MTTRIPSVFQRTYIKGVGRRVIEKPNPKCQWVFDGKGFATIQWDGSTCLVEDRKLFKLRMVHIDRSPFPEGFVMIDGQSAFAKDIYGWVPITDKPEDRWYREAWERFWWGFDEDGSLYKERNGIYEMIGPHVKGKPTYGLTKHELMKHTAGVCRIEVPRTFEGIKEFLEAGNSKGNYLKGIVWHNPDTGEMAKATAVDFGVIPSPRKRKRK